MASGGWVFLDVREFGSKSAFGPGGSRGPGPSASPPRSRLLALPARPWLPTFPRVLFGDGVRAVSGFSGSASQRLRGSVRPLLRSRRAGAGTGEGLLGGGVGPRKPRPRAFAGGAGGAPRRLVACSPYHMAPRQRLKPGSWRASPPRSCVPGTGEGGGGAIWV